MTDMEPIGKRGIYEVKPEAFGAKAGHFVPKN